MANTSVEVNVLGLPEVEKLVEELTRLKTKVAEYEKKEEEAALGKPDKMKILDNGRVVLNRRIVPHRELKHIPSKYTEEKDEAGNILASVEEGYYNVFLDERFGYFLPEKDILSNVHLIANAMAIAAGYTSWDSCRPVGKFNEWFDDGDFGN